MKIRFIYGSLFLFTALPACDGTDVRNLPNYGAGMPGAGLPEGGEVLLEKVFYSPGITGSSAAIVNQFHAYQYTGAFMGATSGPLVDAGGCLEFDHPNTFPVQDIAATADYVDWGESITLTGPGLGGAIEIPQIIAPAGGLTDNRPSPIRNHKEGKWLYGGPTWQGDEFQGVDLQPAGAYELDIGGASPLTFTFAPSYDFPLDAGTEDVTLPATAPAEGLTVTWEAFENPAGAVQTRAHSFTFVAMAKFPDMAAGDRGPTPMFICVPPINEDGEITIPADMFDAAPDQGIFQAGRLTHYMEALDENGEICAPPFTDCRRFDMFAIWCAVSAYSKE